MLAVNHDLLPVFSAMPSKHSFTHASCAGLLKVPALRNRFDIEFRFVRSMQSILDGNDSPCYRDNLYAFDVMESYSWLLENPIITTTFRNPAEQSLLFLFKYHRPGCKLYGDGKNCYPFQHSLKLAQRKEKSLRGADFSMFNIASHELGIVDADGMHHFIENAVESDKMHFILFEKWFESLVALRKKTGWRFSDMLHIRAPSAEAHLQSEGAPWVQTLMVRGSLACTFVTSLSNSCFVCNCRRKSLKPVIWTACSSKRCCNSTVAMCNVPRMSKLRPAHNSLTPKLQH